MKIPKKFSNVLMMNNFDTSVGDFLANSVLVKWNTFIKGFQKNLKSIRN